MSEPREITEPAVDSAVDAALAAFAAAADTAALKVAKAAHAGESSPLAALNAQLRDVPAEQKAELGKLVGQARGRVAQAISAREGELAVAEEQARLAAETLDVTAVPALRARGARHPLTALME